MLVPGQQRLTVFCLRLFWGPPPTSSFSGVVAGTGIEQRTGYPENLDHEVDGAFVGRPPPRCDPKCGQRVGAISSGVSETEDHEMDGAFAGCPPRCVTPHAVSGRGQFRLLWARTLTRISSLLLVLVAGGQFRVLLRREGVLCRLVLVFAVFLEGGRTHL